MTKISAWLNAARLRTLPLSVSGVVVGTALANFQGRSHTLIFILALMTTIAFQVISNFANDYGDGVKGTDNEHRIGPKRALQSGILGRRELKKGIILSIVLALFLVLALLYVSFGTEHLHLFVVFVLLGLASIWAAIKYTVGRSAYGYRGLGDIFVFLFFGLLGVLGTLFLYMKTLTWTAILPAATIGFLSTGVLNLNNLRDYESDKNAQKNTLIVKMGFEKGKRYHLLLLVAAFVCLLSFIRITNTDWYHFIPLLAFIPIAVHLVRTISADNSRMLDPELKKLALSTFLLALLFYVCYNNFL